MYLVTDLKPQTHVLLEFLSSVSSKWYEIGALLGVDGNTLDGLLSTNLSNEVKLSKILQNWLNNKPTSTTWRRIIKIIEGPLHNNSLATDIRQYLIKGGTVISHLILVCRGFYVL